MILRTECHWDDWDRIVDIYPERCEAFPEYINDDATYKLIILEKGILHVKTNGTTINVKAPALILLSEKDVFDFRVMQKIKAQILFFKPSAIRDEFTFERVNSGEFDHTVGSAIYQDYMLIKCFTLNDMNEHIIPLPVNGLKRIKDLFTSAEAELKGQRDGFWPCRSRSYLMSLLYYIVYTYFENSQNTVDDEASSEHSEFSRIVEYLNDHIEEQITIDSLVKEFAINRNRLNGLFMNHASMTCMNYLLHLRMDLAKILLTKTEIPIGKVSTRVGYPDSSYFTKVFKKHVGVTPTKYRYP